MWQAIQGKLSSMPDREQPCQQHLLLPRILVAPTTSFPPVNLVNDVRPAKFECISESLVISWRARSSLFIYGDASPGHYASWEPPGRFLDHCKFFFCFVQFRGAGTQIKPLKNISSGTFWKNSKIDNFISSFAHKIYWVSRK